MATSTAIENKILQDQIQEYLGGHEAVYTKIVLDKSASATPGLDRLSIPRTSGLGVEDVENGGSGQADPTIGTALAVAVDVLLLDEFKEVREFIPEKLDIESKVSMEAAFDTVAPKLWVENIENEIHTALYASTNSDNFTSAELAADGGFAIADIATANKLQTIAGMKANGKYMSVNATTMETLASFTEFEDGSKSLSDEALRLGIVSKVKSYNVVEYNGSAADGLKICFFSADAVAFANQGGEERIRKEDRPKAHTFHSIRGKYGVKLLDSGNRALVMTLGVGV